MHTRQKKKQKRLGHVLLYPLPQEVNLVKEVAFVQAITDCYKAHLTGKLTSDATAVQVAADLRCNEYQSARSGGKSGTNDPRMFKEIFTSVYTRAHAAMVRLQRIPDAASGLRTLDDVALATYLHHYTALHPEIVEAAYVGYAFDLAPFS